MRELLKANNTLKELYLYNNNITDVQSIGEGLKANNTLKMKDKNLGGNNITDVQSIGEGLKTNNTLIKTLRLDNNNITDEASIGEFLKNKQYIKDIGAYMVITCLYNLGMNCIIFKQKNGKVRMDMQKL